MATRPAQTQSNGPQGPYHVLEATDGGLYLFLFTDPRQLWLRAAYAHVESLTAPGRTLGNCLDALDAGLDLTVLGIPVQPEADPWALYRAVMGSDGGARVAGQPAARVIVHGGDGSRKMDVSQMSAQARQALDVSCLEAQRHSRRARAKAHLE